MSRCSEALLETKLRFCNTIQMLKHEEKDQRNHREDGEECHEKKFDT